MIVKMFRATWQQVLRTPISKKPLKLPIVIASDKTKKPTENKWMNGCKMNLWI
jgi:hypothetical protein